MEKNKTKINNDKLFVQVAAPIMFVGLLYALTVVYALPIEVFFVALCAIAFTICYISLCFNK